MNSWADLSGFGAQMPNNQNQQALSATAPEADDGGAYRLCFQRLEDGDNVIWQKI